MHSIKQLLHHYDGRPRSRPLVSVDGNHTTRAAATAMRLLHLLPCHAAWYTARRDQRQQMKRGTEEQAEQRAGAWQSSMGPAASARLAGWYYAATDRMGPRIIKRDLPLARLTWAGLLARHRHASSGPRAPTRARVMATRRHHLTTWPCLPACRAEAPPRPGSFRFLTSRPGLLPLHLACPLRSASSRAVPGRGACEKGKSRSSSSGPAAARMGPGPVPVKRSLAGVVEKV